PGAALVAAPIPVGTARSPPAIAARAATISSRFPTGLARPGLHRVPGEAALQPGGSGSFLCVRGRANALTTARGLPGGKLLAELRILGPQAGCEKCASHENRCQSEGAVLFHGGKRRRGPKLRVRRLCQDMVRTVTD